MKIEKQINIKCDDTELVPAHALSGDAGLDLRSSEDLIIAPNEIALVSTGVIIELPNDTVGMVCSKSGLALKNGIFVLNAPGIIDSGYRGEIKVILKNGGKSNYKIDKYSKIAQFVVLKFYKVSFNRTNELSESVRGNKGFGSTGL